MIIYCFSAFLLLLAIGLLLNRSLGNRHFQYSIVIACRNEEANLPALLESIRKLDYPNSDWEVIIVDDSSTDKSLSILQEYRSTINNCTILHLKEAERVLKGKKSALTKGITQSRFDYVLLTDADCIIPSDWLHSYNQYIDDSVIMCVGYSPEKDVTDFRYLTQLITAAQFGATIGLKFPFSCSGRNLLLKKETFFKVGGYSSMVNYIAGDDKLLLQLFAKEKGKVTYNPKGKVLTHFSGSHYIDQQKRRYGKFWMSSTIYKLLVILVFLFFLYLPIKLVFAFCLTELLAYTIASFALVTSAIIVHHEKWHWSYYILSFFLPYYVIYYSIVGTFSHWTWK